MDTQEIKQRYERLKSMRQVVQDTWDEIERFIAPYRGRFFKDERSEESVEWRRPQVYDATAVMASQSLAAHLHSSLTSPKIKWFDLRFRAENLQGDQEAIAWLDQVSDLMFKTLQDSNFTVQAGETYQDLTDFGTSIITEEPESMTGDDWEGVNFTSIPLKEGFFEQDHKGQVQNFYRALEWSPVQMVSKFGEDGVPDIIAQQALEPEQAEKRQTVIFCVFKRPDVDEKAIDIWKPLAPLARPYGYKWMLHTTGELLGKEGGYYEMPAFLPRWRKTSSSMWGNSPAMVALSDTMTLNRLIELHIQSMEKVVDPAILTTERGLMGDLDLNAGGLSVVRDINDIRPFESGARFDVVYQEIQRYRDQIREYFMIDQLMLPPMQGTPATATEIAARISQLERLIGPTLGRLQNDFLDPLITRTFNIMMRAGVLPEPPASVRETPSGLDIEYVGALARSQQQDQVDAVDRWLLQLTQMAQINPDVLDIPAWDKMVKGNAAMLGVPAKYMNGDVKIKAQREERAAQQQAMAQAQLAETQGKAEEHFAKAEAQG